MLATLTGFPFTCVPLSVSIGGKPGNETLEWISQCFKGSLLRGVPQCLLLSREAPEKTLSDLYLLIEMFILIGFLCPSACQAPTATHMWSKRQPSSLQKGGFLVPWSALPQLLGLHLLPLLSPFWPCWILLPAILYKTLHPPKEDICIHTTANDPLCHGRTNTTCKATYPIEVKINTNMFLKNKHKNIASIPTFHSESFIDSYSFAIFLLP